MTFWERLFLSTAEKEEGDQASYLRRISDGSFKDKLVYGVAEEKRGFLALDPVEQPGALYCGGMGSGKSVAMRFTVVTNFICNSENTVYIMIDPLKGMTDYAPLFKYKENVAVAVNDTAKLVPAIKMLYQECMARKEAFSAIQANNIYTYERMMRQKDPSFPGVARIMICMEEFHAVPASNEVKYHMNVDRPGSIAAMLKELMRVGRSYGITLLAATQRATSDDFPSSLKPGITQLMAFKVNNPGDATAINLAHAADIRSEQRGRCAYEGGFIQFPYFDDKGCAKLLEKHYKPLRAKLFKYTMDKYHEAFAGEGNAGMTKVEPIKSLLDNLNQYKVEDVSSRILESFDFETAPQTNTAYVASMLAQKNNKTYGVYIVQTPDQSSPKAIDALKKGLNFLNCESVIIVNYGKSMPPSLDAFVKDFGGYAVDLEDMNRIAQVLDNKDKLDEEKYQLLYGELALVPKKEVLKKGAEEVQWKDAKGGELSAPKKESKENFDDLFAELDQIVKKKPELAPAPKEEKKSEPVVAKQTSEVVAESGIEEEFKRPISSVGGSSMLNLREKLKASMAAQKAKEEARSES